MERNNQKNAKFPFPDALDLEGLNNLNRLWSVTIIDQLIKCGVRDFYLSPGMRNAPLIYALTKAKQINVYDILDERSAGYRALGNAKASQSPTALICTSGTALANYLPAVIEAKKTNTPLIILSADRPIELIEHNANQSIQQIGIFSHYINFQLALPCPAEDESLLWLASKTCETFYHATGKTQGPVHINIPFRDPLDQSVTNISEVHKAQFQKVLLCNSFFKIIDRFEINLFLDKFLSKKCLISIGDNSSLNLSYEDIENLKNLGVPLYFDITSGYKFNYNLNKNTLPSFDHPEVYSTFEKNPPEVIIHLGGRMTSKHYYRFLESNPNIEVIQISNNFLYSNPSNSKITHYSDDYHAIEWNKPKVDKKNFQSFDFTFIKKKSQVIENSPLSFPLLSKSIVENLPSFKRLMIGNSTLIRSFDLYSSYECEKSFSIHSNRGASGIEGLLSTAIGLIDATNEELYILIGDISLLHDMGSFNLINKLTQKITVIVANNQAGGIFNLLPISEEKEILKHMQTYHENNFKLIAQQFGLEYTCISTKAHLVEVLKKCDQKSNHQLIEVCIDDEVNKNIYNQLKTVKL